MAECILSLDQTIELLTSTGQDYLQCRIVINDQDGLIQSINTLHYNNVDIFQDIEEQGSIKTYIDRSNRSSYEDVIFLESIGIQPTIARQVLTIVNNTEYGDSFFERLFYTTRLIGSNIVVKGNKERVAPEYRDYRCWETFQLSQPYTEYEYNKWLGSCFDLAANNVGSGLSLLCQLKIPAAQVKVIMHDLFPGLIYKLVSQTLSIPLDEIAYLV